MIVASIFVPRPKENRWNCDYDALLALLDASCNKFDLKHVVISDSPRPFATFICPQPLPQNLMSLLLEGQKQLLEHYDEPVLLVGADCLIARDPRSLFLADLTITTDDSFSDCRMNTGAIFCSNGMDCAKVWQSAVNAKPEHWGQDQIYLYEAIKRSDLSMREISCDEHNRAPDSLEDGKISTVVHFRGRRKAWMKDWAKRYLDLEAVA